LRITRFVLMWHAVIRYMVLCTMCVLNSKHCSYYKLSQVGIGGDEASGMVAQFRFVD
jgi:hypothetical protein